MTKRISSKRKIYLQLGINVWSKAPFLWKNAYKDKWKTSPGEHKKRHRISERYSAITKSNAIRNMVQLGYTTSRPAYKVKLSYYEPKYASQLKEKQKLRGFYRNINEKQLRIIYTRAKKYRGKIGDTIITICEKRLDTVLYRASFVNSLYQARQLISHGHVYINGKVRTTCSHTIMSGDLVSIKPEIVNVLSKGYNWTILKNAGSDVLKHVPYLEVDYKTMSLIFLYTPTIEEVQMSFSLDMNKVIRHYI